MYHDLTKGSISRSLLLFALSMIAGNMLQQLYNIADTLIVGRVLGRNALAAVGSAYALLTFLTSIFLGLSMGAGALFSIYKGKGEKEALKASVYHGFVLIMSVTVILNIAVYLFLDPILHFLKVPAEVWDGMREYLLIIFAGILATSLYNFFACLLRALGNSAVPLWFLAVSALVNVGLALLFVAVWRWGIRGAAFATILAQFLSGIGITCYVFFQTQRALAGSAVQGLVNSFGAVVMAAFAAAVKIDTFAYLPVQDFGNAYATFVAQNYGAVICIFAEPLMKIFISAREAEVIACGVGYLRIEGAFLLWYRLSVFIVWILPWGEAAGNVGGSYGDLSGDAGAFGLSAFCKDRRSGDLGSHSDWMGAGRSDRTFLHAVWEKGGKYLIATGS